MLKIDWLTSKGFALKLLFLCGIITPFTLSAKSHCKAGTEIFSCDIKAKNISVCRVGKNKVLYQFYRNSRSSIKVTSRPFYSKGTFASGYYEALRVNNRQYDYVINSALVTNYADKHRRKIRVAWLDVYKNKRKLAKINCTNSARINTRGLSLVYDNLSGYRDVRLEGKNKKRKASRQAIKTKSNTRNRQPTYKIHILTTSNKRKAHKVRSVFQKEGYLATVKRIAKAGKKTYYVRIGGYANKSEVIYEQQVMKKRYTRNTHVQKSRIVYD